MNLVLIKNSRGSKSSPLEKVLRSIKWYMEIKNKAVAKINDYFSLTSYRT